MRKILWNGTVDSVLQGNKWNTVKIDNMEYCSRVTVWEESEPGLFKKVSIVKMIRRWLFKGIMFYSLNEIKRQLRQKYPFKLSKIDQYSSSNVDQYLLYERMIHEKALTVRFELMNRSNNLLIWT